MASLQTSHLTPLPEPSEPSSGSSGGQPRALTIFSPGIAQSCVYKNELELSSSKNAAGLHRKSRGSSWNTVLPYEYCSVETTKICQIRPFFGAYMAAMHFTKSGFTQPLR
ncbi:hypothetical protein EYF80_025267 [Liparis tanakae]|uniref:Uncharacterized protein n=1 Tax=Liparis tanakae TaxID=230148 RepID=A0A4Z2HF97_9TELE|nr:hypothetical protein EYF80_025267 [Liparis tanakae]